MSINRTFGYGQTALVLCLVINDDRPAKHRALSESWPIAFVQAAIFFKCGISSEEISTWRLLVVQAGGSPPGAAKRCCYLRKTSQITILPNA